MVKIANSAAIRESIPTWPRCGSSHFNSIDVAADVVLLTKGSSLFILPIGIFGMLDVPERTPASDDRNLCKVVFHGRRARGPLESPGIPGIVTGSLALEKRPKKISDEDGCSENLKENADRT